MNRDHALTLVRHACIDWHGGQWTDAYAFGSSGAESRASGAAREILRSDERAARHECPDCDGDDDSCSTCDGTGIHPAPIDDETREALEFLAGEPESD
jgi:hypothetical protein